MSRNAKTTVFLKECMADALLNLMKSIPINKISISMITEKAGVGRATWFRNFTSKRESITFKIVRLWEMWTESHEISERRRYTVENADTFFEYIYSIRNILDIIYSSGMQSAVYDAFYQVMSPQFGENTQDCYHSRFFSYGLFGLVEEWVKRKYRESPEEMSAMFHKNTESI